MFTALMCLSLLALVAVSGVVYSKTMDELFSDRAEPGAPATGV
jgi:hypothetical protein